MKENLNISEKIRILEVEKQQILNKISTLKLEQSKLNLLIQQLSCPTNRGPVREFKFSEIESPFQVMLLQETAEILRLSGSDLEILTKVQSSCICGRLSKETFLELREIPDFLTTLKSLTRKYFENQLV